MAKRLVKYTIPEDLEALLRIKVDDYRIDTFVTQALWEALRQEEALLQEFLDADKDPGNIETKQNFSDLLEGEDFIGLDGFDFTERAINGG